MRLLEINSVCGIGSTGRICTKIADAYVQKGYEVKIAYGRGVVPKEYQKYAVRIGTNLSPIANALKARILDNEGFNAQKATKKFLKWADSFDPDILWLHNLHGYFINIELLFNWIKSRPNMEVRWTLHDCWAFTGHCPHFTYARCNKWKDGCFSCIQKPSYPASMLKDNSKANWKFKKNFFTGVKNMTIITPSKWLADLVKQSFLKEYPVKVRYNTIDTDVFKPTPGDFRPRHNLEDKKIILGVASVWDKKKGFEDFLKLSEIIGPDCFIVMVGLSKKQLSVLPRNILGICHTNSAKELAEIYTAADVFVNLTYEDNYPTVNLEAAACGTPVITYRTGGSVESVREENIIEQGNIEEVKDRIYEIVS